MTKKLDAPQLMTPAEVAKAFRVDSKTVTRWAQQGRIDCIFTLGGHRRFRRDVVEALLNGTTPGGGQ